MVSLCVTLVQLACHFQPRQKYFLLAIADGHKKTKKHVTNKMENTIVRIKGWGKTLNPRELIHLLIMCSYQGFLCIMITGRHLKVKTFLKAWKVQVSMQMILWHWNIHTDSKMLLCLYPLPWNVQKPRYWILQTLNKIKL